MHGRYKSEGRGRQNTARRRATTVALAPAEATADPGLVHLTLENRGGAERVKVQFARQGGAVINELEVGGTAAAWRRNWRWPPAPSTR